MDRGFARPAAVASPDPESYTVVVVGGAVYARRWHKDARRFLRRNVQVLRTKPVAVQQRPARRDCLSVG